jgi:hypothetical protein
MIRPRPTALILRVALTGILLGTLALSGGAGEARAQQVSSARFVPTSIPAPPAELSTTPPAAAPASSPAKPAGRPQQAAQAAAATTAATAAPTAPATAKLVKPGTGLAGRVSGNASPLAAAGVYAYQLADLALYKVLTDPQGNFLFRDLPAGLYKIIANKPGFLPAVIMVTRDTGKAYQFLELQLAQRTGAAKAGGANPASTAPAGKTARPDQDADFWALRASIPPDVLRDIDAADGPQSQAGSTKAASAAVPAGAGSGLTPGGTLSDAALAAAGGGRFHTEVQAMTGMADVAQVGVGQVSKGKLGIEGQLGEVQVGLSGRFSQVSSDGLFAGGGNAASGSADGKTSALSLNLEAGPSSRITVTSLSNHLLPRTANGPGEPVGLDHYQVSWSQKLGENSHSDFAAQYTSENNYNRQSAIDPATIPGASRTWNVEGSYTTGLGESGDNTLQAGFRYSDSLLDLAPVASFLAGMPSGSGSYAPLAPLGTLAPLAPNTPSSLANLEADHQSIDFFSRGGTRLQPAFLVEYGLYTTLLDGSVSLTPQGGMVLQMDDGWQARGSATHRVYQESPINPQFLPALFKESELCEQDARACYELSLSRHGSDDDAISFSGLERIVGQTLRLYFSDQVFDRLESIYLVPGDRVPEARLTVSHRLSPGVKTSFESSFATGGGGVFVGADGRPYRNQLRYMVTSLDTRFLHTSTGVFLAFQHLTQGQVPLASGIGVLGATASMAPMAPVDFDRLQLMLSQDLSILWNLASQWALQVDMELSRGTAPYLVSTDTQLHRSILGGIAIKF